MAWGNFVLDKGLDADAAIGKVRAVKRTATGVAQVAAATDKMLGVDQFGVTTAELAKGKGSSVRVIGVTEWEAGAAVAINDEVTCDSSGRCVPVGANVAASLNTGVIADNNALTWTARATGPGGAALSVTIVDPGGATASLSVDVDGNDITVNLARASSAISSTAADVIAAVAEHDTASQLVTVANRSTSNGTGLMTAVAKTNLAGGSGAGGGSRVNGLCVDTPAAAAGDVTTVLLYLGARVI